MPATILSVVGRCCKPRIDNHYQAGPISTVAGHYAKEILWPNAGVGPDDVDLTGSYDAFTFTTMLQLEDYGFCEKGDGGEYVSSGIMRLGGARPNNTSGGHLCEGYTHGMNMVIENVRQLRGEIDDSCPIDANGKRQHTYDYSTGVAAKFVIRKSLPISVGRCLVQGRRSSWQKENDDAASRRISRHVGCHTGRRSTESGVLYPLWTGGAAPAVMREVHATSLPDDDCLSLVCRV
jgi:hypothetical protein